MLGRGCGVSQFPKFYVIIKKRHKILPHPQLVIYEGDKGNQFLEEKWIVESEKPVELFVRVSISDTPTIKYWHTLERIMVNAKDNIPKECRIGDICFTSLATIVGNLFTKHPNKY